MFHVEESYYLVSFYISGGDLQGCAVGVPTFANGWALRKYIYFTHATLPSGWAWGWVKKAYIFCHLKMLNYFLLILSLGSGYIHTWKQTWFF